MLVRHSNTEFHPLLGGFDLGKIPRGGQSALEFWNGSILQEAFGFHLCLCLVGLVHCCSVLGLCKSLVYYGRLVVTSPRHPRKTGMRERCWLCVREPGSWVEHSSRYLAAG